MQRRLRQLGVCLLALAGVAALTAPAGAQRVQTRPDFDQTIAVPLELGGDCTVGQTNDINGQAGLDDAVFQLQGFCIDNPPGEPADLKGFAFPFTACRTGAIDEIAVNFRVAEKDDRFFLYVWRDFGGLPNDACGLEAFVDFEEINDSGPFFSIYDICDASVPLAQGERFFVGLVYRVISNIDGPDWLVGRNTATGFIDHGYVNLSGEHGDWADLATVNPALGNRWGIFTSISDDCGAVPVEESTWGAVKAIMR